MSQTGKTSSGKTKASEALMRYRRYGCLPLIAAAVVMVGSCSQVCKPEDKIDRIESVTKIIDRGYGSYTIESIGSYGYTRTRDFNSLKNARVDFHYTVDRDDDKYAVINMVGNCICSHNVGSIDVYLHSSDDVIKKYNYYGNRYGDSGTFGSSSRYR